VLKPVEWVGNSKAALLSFPRDVMREVGRALTVAQAGGKHPHAKPLKGFGGAGVLEIVENHGGSTYRGVYTVRFAEVIYVLHCFQKKAKRGIATPRQEVELIKGRLRIAQDHHRRVYGAGRGR